MLAANSGDSSKKSPSSTTFRISSLMSWGLLGLSGTSVSSGRLAVGRIEVGAPAPSRDCSTAGKSTKAAEVAGWPRRRSRRRVGDARFLGVGERAAQFLLGHRLVGHRLHHVGTGDEHVETVLHHEDEVGHGRRETAPARPHHHGDLRGSRPRPQTRCAGTRRRSRPAIDALLNARLPESFSPSTGADLSWPCP